MYHKEGNIMRWELCLIIIIGTILFFIYQYPAIFNNNLINDDVRVHYYPVYKIKDPSLFKNDITTDIFIFETPKLFLYTIYIFSYLIDIIILSKLISYIIYLLIAYFAYKVGSVYLSKQGRIFFLILFLIQIWSFPTISGGLPRSLSYLFVLGFIYYHATSQNIKKSIILVAALLLYTPALFITWLTYALLKLQDLIILVKKKKFTYDFKVFIIVTLVLLSTGYFLYSDAHDNRFGKIADYSEVSTNIAFSENGRVHFYPVKPYHEIIFSYAKPLIILTLVFLIPFLYINKKKTFSLPKEIWLLMLSGIILHYLAGYTGLQLHWYTRFARYTFPFILVLLFSKNFDLIYHVTIKRFRLVFFFLMLIITCVFIASGTSRDFLMECDKTDVYSFLSTTGKDSVVAGHPLETSCIPLCSKRKIFTSDEAISPAYSDYYEKIKKRTMDFFKAYYSDNISVVQTFCKQYSIDYLLVDYIYLDDLEFSYLVFYEPFNSYINNITENQSYFILRNIDDEKKIINNEDYYLIRCEDLDNEK